MTERGFIYFKGDFGHGAIFSFDPTDSNYTKTAGF